MSESLSWPRETHFGSHNLPLIIFSLAAETRVERFVSKDIPGSIHHQLGLRRTLAAEILTM